MNFIPYENVPLHLAIDGQNGDFIFAESASISVSQPLSETRQVDDNIFQICAYSSQTNPVLSYSPVTFNANQNYSVILGPTFGPPRPLATSIFKIEKDTKITFPGNRHLYFSDEIRPEGHNYVVDVYAKEGNWSLTQDEAQQGYFEPLYNYVASGPPQGQLDVSFYVNAGNLPNFFNITGLSNPLQYPPIDETKITGFFGDFIFNDAYLKSFNFSLSPNSISQASASFILFGELEKDTSISSTYFNSSLYQQQSVPHGQNSQIVGTSSFDMDHSIGFSYNIEVDLSPKYEMPAGDSSSLQGLVPSRVSKKSTNVSMSVQGNNLNPDILSDGFNGKRANLSANLFDLSYNNFEDQNQNLLHSFQCDGVITSQNLLVNSDGYLDGSVSVTQHLK